MFPERYLRFGRRDNRTRLPGKKEAGLFMDFLRTRRKTTLPMMQPGKESKLKVLKLNLVVATPAVELIFALNEHDATVSTRRPAMPRGGEGVGGGPRPIKHWHHLESSLPTSAPAVQPRPLWQTAIGLSANSTFCHQKWGGGSSPSRAERTIWCHWRTLASGLNTATPAHLKLLSPPPN